MPTRMPVPESILFPWWQRTPESASGDVMSQGLPLSELGATGKLAALAARFPRLQKILQEIQATGPSISGYVTGPPDPGPVPAEAPDPPVKDLPTTLPKEAMTPEAAEAFALALLASLQQGQQKKKPPQKRKPEPEKKPAPKPESRQQGGAVTGGRPYTVGERGPEVIVPTESGVVIPHQAGGASDPMTEAIFAAFARSGLPLSMLTHPLVKRLVVALAQAMEAQKGKAGTKTPETKPKKPESRQGGGPIAAGQPYRVGEGGPETVLPFVPDFRTENLKDPITGDAIVGGAGTRAPDPMLALQKAQTIGAPQIGERYVPTEGPQSLFNLFLQYGLGGQGRPQGTIAQDPYGILGWERGAGPMPMIGGTTSFNNPFGTSAERLARSRALALPDLDMSAAARAERANKYFPLTLWRATSSPEAGTRLQMRDPIAPPGRRESDFLIHGGTTREPATHIAANYATRGDPALIEELRVRPGRSFDVPDPHQFKDAFNVWHTLRDQRSFDLIRALARQHGVEPPREFRTYGNVHPQSEAWPSITDPVTHQGLMNISRRYVDAAGIGPWDLRTPAQQMAALEQLQEPYQREVRAYMTRRGYGSFRYPNFSEGSGEQNYGLFWPRQVRYPEAGFDPRRVHSRNMLASILSAIGLGGLGAAGAAGQQAGQQGQPPDQ